MDKLNLKEKLLFSPAMIKHESRLGYLNPVYFEAQTVIMWTTAMLSSRSALGIYDETTEIITKEGNPRLPFELWKKINDTLPLNAQASFALASAGAYTLAGLSDASENKTANASNEAVASTSAADPQKKQIMVSHCKYTFYNNAIRERRMEIHKLFAAAIRDGNQDAVEAMLKKDTSLLFERYKISVRGLYPQPRIFEGTLFEIMLSQGDFDMCHMMEKYFKLLPNGQEVRTEQIN